MVKAKANETLTILGADVTSTDVHEGYPTHIKSKVNSSVKDTGEINVLQWEPCGNNNDDALAGAAAPLSLLSSPTDSSNSQPFNNNHMKCFYDCTHGHFLDYFNDSIPDDAVIYADDVPFQYKKVEGRYTEFICNPTGTNFMVVKRDHEVPSNQCRIMLICLAIHLNLEHLILTRIVVILFK